ncbi:SAM-dependent methyltransferase [Occallatibacter savannae]|uniref:SAM-dependent methyltransferase n=1 Tax=Occallatibacter savannae TaxID=1002691 RepID=UPI000D69A326|nr:class I SAM-dependent methyltransferase [Occallatibacter savannae]
MAQTITAATLASSLSEERFQRYYEEAGPDYAAWSPGFNMHFGYYRSGMNPFDREAMLEQMNCEVLDRLRISSGGAPRVLDMGCGLGATLRTIARKLPNAELHGITLVPWQLEQGRRLNQSAAGTSHIRLALANYEDTGYPSMNYDAVYALESSCYGTGSGKSRLIREAHRLLRPGGRLVVADGFISQGRFRGPQRAIFRKLCECWVIETLGDIRAFAEELRNAGFRDITVERMQAGVSPSVFHVPFVTMKFLLTDVLFGPRKMTQARWNNVLAPVLLPLVGFPVGPLAYFLVSATRA